MGVPLSYMPAIPFPFHCLFLFGFLVTSSFAESNEPAWKSLPTTKVSEEVLGKIESHSDLVYARYKTGNEERNLLLDLYRPREIKRDRPAIVCIHGGAWWKGEKRNISILAKTLAAKGFVTVTINYRLSGEKPFPAQIEDTKAAVRWLRANASQYGIDSDWIGAVGSSAGGHLAALLATSGEVAELEGEGGNASFSSTIQAAVAIGAQSDLLSERIKKRSEDPAAKFYPQFLGGTQVEALETYRLASPLHHLDSLDPPVFFLTGRLDDPSTHGDTMRKRMEKMEIPNSLVIIEGAPHPFLTRQPFFDTAVEKMLSFFGAHLK